MIQEPLALPDDRSSESPTTHQPWYPAADLLRQPSGLLQAAARRLAVPYFYGLWAWIAGVSLYDAYLVQRYQTVILDLEQNPICELLIRWDPMDLTYFWAGKVGGTVLALSILWLLFRFRRRLAIPAISGVACFQFALCCYLQFAAH